MVGGGVAEKTRPRWRYAALGAALAASALSLVPGYAGVLLLGAAGVLTFGLLGGRLTKLVELRSRLASWWRGRFEPDLRLVLLRWFVAGCQAVTVLTTWRLWEARDYPPVLPALRVPNIDFGPAVLASLLLVLAVPRAGIWLHLATLAVAMAADQTRLQPEFVSLGLILVATNVPGWGLTVGRAHLVAMWAWAGLNKVLSTDFSTGSAPWMYAGLPFELPLVRSWFGALVAGTELGTGIAMLIPPLRRIGVVSALGLHGTILLLLSPWGQDWNESVWAWNLALGPAAALLFWPVAEPEPEEEPQPAAGRRWPKWAIVAVAALYPAGFYFGLSDAYLSHHLYSDAVSLAYCEPVGSCTSASFADTWEAAKVPLPPEPRLYAGYFSARCRPEETLVILPRRTKLEALNGEVIRYDCPSARDR